MSARLKLLAYGKGANWNREFLPLKSFLYVFNQVSDQYKAPICLDYEGKACKCWTAAWLPI